MEAVQTRPLNRKQQMLYRRLSVLSELILQTFEDLEQEQKDKRFKVSKHFEQFRVDLERVKNMCSEILEIIFKDPKIRTNTYFTDLVNKVDTVIRKTELYN